MDTLLGENIAAIPHGSPIGIWPRLWSTMARSTNIVQGNQTVSISLCMRKLPVLEEIRTMFGSPDFLQNLETLVKRIT